MYKLMRTEEGFCRVYYRNRSMVYCLQNDGGWGRRRLEFYRCTPDGEPSYPVPMPDETEFDNYVEP